MSRAQGPARCSRSPWLTISTAPRSPAPCGSFPAAAASPASCRTISWPVTRAGIKGPELIHWMRDAETNLPQQATIAFADPGRDYQVNAQVARRVAGSAQNNLSSQVPIVLDVPHGAQLADRMLWEVWNSRDTATFAADDRLIGIDARPGLSLHHARRPRALAHQDQAARREWRDQFRGAARSRRGLSIDEPGRRRRRRPPRRSTCPARPSCS
jgi:hypothetical protein